MTIADFIARFERVVKTSKGFMVRCPAHEDGKASLSVSEGKDGKILLKCFAGCSLENVCVSLGLKTSDLFPDSPKKFFHPPTTAKKPSPAKPPEKGVIEKLYSYTDSLGGELYQVVRYKPKDFRQRHRGPAEEWIWNMDGVERVLYRLPEVMKADTVLIVEGEKDVDNLAPLGFCATCNVGGAEKWLDGYNAFLSGKHIVICGDNDDSGERHVKQVFNSVSKAVKTVKVVKVPLPSKDVSEFLGTFTDGKGAAALKSLIDDAVPHVGGVRLPVYSMADLEPRYKGMVRSATEVSLDLGSWIPTFRGKIRPLIPGEMMLIAGDTGTGKTAILSTIALHTQLPTLLFEMELPLELLYERFVAAKFNFRCAEIEDNYRIHNDEIGPEMLNGAFSHLFICPDSGLTVEKLGEIISRADLRIGRRPILVLIDYVQLVRGTGPRYEKASEVAEGLKVLAKSSQTIIVVASQLSRHAAADVEVHLHAAKDSGSLENSAGIVLGVWRDENDSTAMHVRVLKATKGGAGTSAVLNFDGARMRITERHIP